MEFNFSGFVWKTIPKITVLCLFIGWPELTEYLVNLKRNYFLYFELNTHLRLRIPNTFKVRDPETKKYGISVIDNLILVEKICIYNIYFNIIFYVFCLNIWFAICFYIKLLGPISRDWNVQIQNGLLPAPLCIMRINNLFWSFLHFINLLSKIK